jgi:hypothetical protein
MDPAMQQFFTEQMQLIQNLTATVQNLQAQQNQPPPQGPPPPPPPVNKHREFMSHNPPTYSHSVDPLDADDWLKTINKMLNITQCNDREKVLPRARCRCRTLARVSPPPPIPAVRRLLCSSAAV